MIFVTVGTQPNGFIRCLREVECLIDQGVITEEVVAQIGYTKFETTKFKATTFMSEKEFKEYIKNASVVITHAGSGTIFNSIKAGKKVIAMARLHSLNEMADDHQTELINKLARDGYIIDGTDSLATAWSVLDGFEPKKCDFSNEIVSVLDVYISKVFDE